MKPLLILPLILLLLSFGQLQADWPCTVTGSIAISTAAGNQWNARVVPDGSGGAIMVWQDRRDGTNDRIYAQRIDGVGNIKWLAEGVALSTSSGLQFNPQLVPDGTGGAFVVWQDNRYGTDYDIFAQRISSSGIATWYPGGTLICNATGHQYNPQVVPDGAGGIIIAWQDRRDARFDIYSQRMSGNGQPVWTTNGIAVCSAPGDQTYPQLVSDGLGGAIVGWTDFRGDDGMSDVYVQKVGAAGSVEWGENGLALCAAANMQWNVQLAPSANGSAVVVWQDRRSGSLDQIYAQTVSPIGTSLWASDGVPLCESPGIQYNPRPASDGKGGTVITWQDNRSGADYDIYAQYLGPEGLRMWAPEGLPICTAPGHQYYPMVTIDKGGALFTWQDKRNGTDFDVYAQRVDLSGSPIWQASGVPVIQLAEDQFAPQFAGDGTGGAVVLWSDYRAKNGFSDLYAQRIGANGKPAGGCYRSFTQDSLSLKAARLRVGVRRPLRMPNTGNVRDTLFARGAFPDGIILGLERTDSSSHYGWILFTKAYYTRLALPQRGSPRSFKSIFGREFVGQYKNLRARRYSNRITGEALALKLNIAASDAGITEPNFGDLVFRDPAVPSNPLNNRTLRQVSEFVDSVLTIWRAYPTIRYVQIDTSLRNINRAFSGPIDTNSAAPLSITSVRPLFSVPYLIPDVARPAAIPPMQAIALEEELPGEFELRQNYPNPFNPFTTIEFVLTEPAVVSLKIFNILGQEVASLANNEMLDEGVQVFDFDASAYPSGVYFYQVMVRPVDEKAASYSRTLKMMLMK
jgi:hypothetical protein